jgi:hypothetical protein
MFMNKYTPDESYVLCEASTLKYSENNLYEPSYTMARWVYKLTSEKVKLHRIYPAMGAMILVTRSSMDADTIAQLKADVYDGEPITIRRLSDEEYSKLRGNVYHAGCKWAWKVTFIADEFDWVEVEPNANSCCGQMQGGVAQNQFHHPVTGHLMCIVCMHPLETGDFNVCHPCASGHTREVWKAV